ncbi:DUF3857 domain-containing protein [Mucilaginibacter ginsenosidivorans]|uniref:DUF3857 domain-containing protein n=1 Tax=Mucilaginibacter ginsenosidivorans TaxID=398053 RepID=A0A5B8USF5_9SPHI|nr:DUF3857 domain-containing transglutaminase family protein [Mucilaginibacter ginsenosidivorans]QEC61341.1 DUF3857 domain-containing protein [Mucilaginibacter ginsenosidivorans]
MELNNYIKGLLLFAGLFFFGPAARSQDKDIPKELYTATGIPDSLKEDANSVVRYSFDELKITGPGKETRKHHSLITILNEKGDHEAFLQYAYNKKYDNYSFIDVHIYDKNGKMIKKYHKSDMYDGAVSMEATLVNDERFLGLKHSVADYPETIEVEYEEIKTSLIDLGQWWIQGDQQSIQNEFYTISINSDAGFRYFNRNITLMPEKTSSGNIDTYAWRVLNLKAFKLEERAMPWRVSPVIKFGQSKFDFFGNPGDLSSWQTYGKWQLALNSDVCSLSAERIAEIKKMTDTIKTDKEKAKFLYKYMQQNMRYVSIQLGIGGLKPFAATFVDEKKYGDCKALSNYMYALLKAVNINSYYTIIRAGENEEPANYSFPYDNFNHVILCIPFKNDTTWLECTSNKTAFGELGSFTENRNALIITEDGGKLINTPKSKAIENQFNSDVHITLSPNGGAKTQINISSTGEYRELFLAVEAAKADEQKQFWLEELGIKQPSSFDFDQGKDINGIKRVELKFEYDQFCDVMTADKQFYRPSAFKLWANTVPIPDKPRKADFYWEWPRIKSCTTTIDVPAGYEVETMPANASLKFTYGNYDVNYVYNKDKNQVISTAKFVLSNHVIPAAKYTEMQEYLDAVAKVQNKKLVIHKKA